ncbi:MAG: FkbM family methyltransferase [Pseudomonadota bacterium]
MLDLVFPENHRISIPVRHKSHIARSLKGLGIHAFEPVSQAVFLAAVERRDGAVVDVGANIGLFSMCIASALGRDVAAFEPFEEAASALEEVAVTYGLPIRVTRAAVADRDGTASFYLSKKSDMSNSLDREHRDHRGVREVPIVSIDSWDDAGQIAAVKIDTERTEMDVLRGMTAIARRDRPAILVEILSDKDANDLACWKEDLGYRSVDLGSDEVYGRILGPFTLPDLEGDMRNTLLVPSDFATDDAFFDRARFWVDEIRSCALR